MNNTISIRTCSIAFIILASISCESTSEPTQTSVASTEDKLPAGQFLLTKEQMNASKMQTGSFEMKLFHKVVKTNGMFEVPPQNRASISAYFGGYVKDIDLLPGEQIKKGQVLFTLENPDYIQVQQDFLESKNELVYLKSDYERQKNLAQENVTSKKNFLKIESEYKAMKVRFEANKKRLQLMNIRSSELTEDKLRTVIPVLAPISGYVTEVNATKGMFLNPSDVAISIIDPDHLHLELTIYEKDLSDVQIGQIIEFNIHSDSRQQYKAAIHLVNKEIDITNRSIIVHGHLSNEKEIALFTPGMYVEAEIFTSENESYALPQDAIVNLEGTYFILVKDSDNNGGTKFVKREVKIGQTTKGYTAILNSQEIGIESEVLLSGAYTLLN